MFDTIPMEQFAFSKSLRIALLISFFLICRNPVLSIGEEDSEIRLVGVAPTDGRVEPTMLKQLEARLLPPVIQPGSARFSNFSDYYWSENEALRDRLEMARDISQSSQPFRGLTLIAGSAGIGKTFIKRDIATGDIPAESVCSFDVKDLFHQWKAEGLVEERCDLYCSDVTLCSLPAIKPGQPELMRRFLEKQSAHFFVIDSLDEVHPDDYVPLLSQIESFVSQSDRRFLHVVVLGRPLAFRDYWRTKANSHPSDRVALFMLNPPRLLTTGDLMVSSWNYHTWRYKLRWQSTGGEIQKMPLESYIRWVKSGYPDSFANHRVLYNPNKNMNTNVQATIETWAQQYPIVNSMLCNLAGNGMLREIAEQFAHENRPYDERAVMEAYLAKWLERDTKCENRPSPAKPEHLELYLCLVEGVAIKYLREDTVDSNGLFNVADDDQIEVARGVRKMQFPVVRILDRSGLKYNDPRHTGAAAYRFEPVWFHRLMVEKYNEKQRTIVNR